MNTPLFNLDTIPYTCDSDKGRISLSASSLIVNLTADFTDLIGSTHYLI
jgi:hypothetical protein